MEITEGVHTIESLGIGRAYIYQEQDKLTLIDTGLRDSTERILAVVEKIGRKPEDVRQIFITHHHNDHTGSLAELVERTGAQVLAQCAQDSQDVHIQLSSELTAESVMQRLKRAYLLFTDAFGPFEIVRVDVRWSV